MRVLYEDEYLLLAFKPKALLSCPFFEIGFSFWAFLLCRHSSNAAPAHRLDYGTCGVIVAHKLSLTRVSLARQFYKSDLVKKYACLSACSDLHTSNLCLFSNLTTFLARPLKLNLLSCKLVTGKRHVIRLLQRGVCGDRVYYAGSQLFGVWGCLIRSLCYQCLSAYLVCFRHAVSFKLLAVERSLEPLFRYLLINFLKLSALRI